VEYNSGVENQPTGFIVPEGPGLTARALLGPLIADAPIGLALVDGTFRYVFVNATLAAFGGRPVEDHFDAFVEDVIAPELWRSLSRGSSGR